MRRRPGTEGSKIKSRSGKSDRDNKPRSKSTFERSSGNRERTFDGGKKKFDGKEKSVSPSRRFEKDGEEKKRTYGNSSRSSGEKRFSKPDNDRKYPRRKSFGDDNQSTSSTRTFRKRDEGSANSYRRKTSEERNYSDRKPMRKRIGDDEIKPFGTRNTKSDYQPKTYRTKGTENKSYSERKSRYTNDSGENDRTPNRFKSGGNERPDRKGFDARSRNSEERSEKTTSRRTTARTDRTDSGSSKYSGKRSSYTKREGYDRKSSDFKPTSRSRKSKVEKEEGFAESVRLNRYISNAGICSRREADTLIGAGLVSVNGMVITEMGFQVKPGDEVKYNNSRISTEKKVYIIINKPKDTITTLDDPDKRKIITDIIKEDGLPRIYPVGRLDRNTTGVLLLTNDGELAQRLMHPKYEVKKIYLATLQKAIKGEDLWTLTNGIELEDGFIKPDSIALPDPKIKNEVGIEIHSGRNRIVHRIFEHVGYPLEKLDRVWYAGLNKRGLKRGQWRHLEERELKALKKMVKLA